MTVLSSLYRRLPLDSLVTHNIYLYLFVRGLVKYFDIFLPHEPDFAAFQFLPARAGVFLDIGANDGLASRSFRKFNKKTPIIALEANRHHRNALERCKRMVEQFDYMILGAGERTERVTLFTPVYRGLALTSYSSLSEAEARRNLQTYLRIPHIAQRVSFVKTGVDIRAVDDFAFRPGFVKIDVEGFEIPVLKGMRRTIAKWRPIFMIEFHAENFETTASLLSSYGYKIFTYDCQTESFAHYHGQDALNLFFVHSEQAGRLPRSS